MRQVVLAAPGTIEIRADAPRPEPGAGDLRVRSESVGICGSDLHALAGHHPFIDLPVVPGHEAAGVVEAVGDGVGGFAPGDRVLLEPNLIDATCHYCRTGRYNLCEHLQVAGCTTDGALGEAFVAPAGRFHRIPDGMSMTEAAMVEPLSTATHAARVAGDLDGRTVAVLGAGTIGLLTMLTARACGAAAVAITDPVARKRAFALELGADLVVDPMDAGMVRRIRAGLPWRPDVVFDCVTTQASVDQAIALALKGGTIVVEGVPRAAVEVPLPLIQDRELRLQGTAMYTREDVRLAMELIGAGVVPAARLVTAEFPLDRAAEAFKAASGGSEIKVHIKPQPGVAGR